MASEDRVGNELQPEADPIEAQTESATPVGTSPAEKTEKRPSEIEELKEGMRLRGRVRNIVEFGAFVDLGVGRDGLAHISTLQRAGIDKTLKVGDPLDVQIRKVDIENNRISLTVPGAGRNARKPLDAFQAGQEITGRVVRLVEFGAFVDVGAQTDGLLHISQLAGGYVHHPREVVEVGQEVHVRILDVDKDRRRISLSMKDSEEAQEEASSVMEAPQEDHGPSAFAAAWQEALENRSQRGSRR